MAKAKIDWQAVKLELNNFKTQIKPLNIKAEICDNWVWISGNTKQYAELLRQLDCKFSKDKAMWFFIPPSLLKKEKPIRSLNLIISRLFFLYTAVYS